MKCTLAFVVIVLSAAVAQAQNFSSGSTGADGQLNVIATGITEVQLPPSGVFNFTSVNVAAGATLRFIPNQRNTPVTILAQGNVVVDGSISIDAAFNGAPRVPGPGGFFGGENGPGFGPGGGQPNQNGVWIGPLSLVPLIGGSGGGASTFREFGGGGGGAIVIASSTSIQCSGSISAMGNGAGGPFGYPFGSGGAIRLVANSITGNCNLVAVPGSPGLIRIEAPVGQLFYTGSSNPPAVLSAINPAITPTPTTAALTISSIGGFPVFSDAGVRPGTVDVVLPRGLADPIAVAVQARNIPLGTQVSLNLSGSSGVTYTPGTLAGSFDLSSATLQVSGLNRNTETHLFVFATFDVPQSAALLNPPGPDQLARVRIQAAPGKPSTMAFLRRDGSVIDPKEIPAALLQHLGYLKN